MALLGEQDWRAMNACIERLYACRSLAAFPQLACIELPKVIGADNTTFNYVASSVSKYVAAWAPELGHFEERVRLTAEQLPCHPVARHELATGDISARLISDFCTRREYHALPIYEAVYRDMGYEDQLAFLLFPPGGEMIAMAFARGNRSFTARDRAAADVIRPHLAQAYRNAEAFSRLDPDADLPAWTREVLRVTSVVLDADLRPRRHTPEAREWLARFFVGAPVSHNRLPAAVEHWLRREVRHDHADPAGSRLLTRTRGGERLSMRLLSGETDGKSLLMLELDTPLTASGQLRHAGLTDREVGVLHHVELGRTNLEIAAKLGISALTVRAHLEHIFRKLRVTNRTAAVTRMRRLCATAS